MGEDTIQITYELPLAEVADDFFDRLKSCSQGYASVDYTPLEFRKSPIEKVVVLVHGEAVDALSFLAH